MKRYVRVTSSILALLLVPICSTTSFAWNSRGHMMVAAVAYSNLNQHTRTRVDALLRLNPDRDNWLALIPDGTNAADKKKMLFMIAATWPDRIKTDPDYVSDGPHGGNRPPADPTVANRNSGYDDLNRHKYWHFVDTAFSTDNTHDLNVDHWITDSFGAAKMTAYKNPPIGDGEGPFTLTATYKANAKTLAQQQVALAGARLAKILNDELN